VYHILYGHVFPPQIFLNIIWYLFQYILFYGKCKFCLNFSVFCLAYAYGKNICEIYCELLGNKLPSFLLQPLLLGWHVTVLPSLTQCPQALGLGYSIPTVYKLCYLE
jgi:hypothetical protein